MKKIFEFYFIVYKDGKLSVRCGFFLLLLLKIIIVVFFIILWFIKKFLKFIVLFKKFEVVLKNKKSVYIFIMYVMNVSKVVLKFLL